MNNWLVYVVVLLAVVAFGTIVLVTTKNFLKLPPDEQLAKVQEWLLWAVTEAERDLGAGTGALKLRYVYDNFILRFPALVDIISFDNFSKMVDTALGKMRYILDTNVAARQYVDIGGQM